jgi:glycine hydroxymethyltransferase
MQPQFKTYARQIVNNAKTLGQTIKKGSFKLVGNGSQNHLLLAIGLQGQQIGDYGLLDNFFCHITSFLD